MVGRVPRSYGRRVDTNGTLLLTGFPGFLGSALLPRLLDRRTGATALCLVQQQHLGTARARIAELEREHPHVRERVDLVTGDITVPGLGLDAEARARVDDVTELWHLAAVYDLAVPVEVAHRVNVDGTAHVLDLCDSLPRLGRLQYVSTCYVSGRYDGEFGEDVLAVGERHRRSIEPDQLRRDGGVVSAMTGAAAKPAEERSPRCRK